MKIVRMVMMLLALAPVTLGQSYRMTAPAVAASYDVSTMTATVNAWKYYPGNPVCASQTLEWGKLDNSSSCIGTDGYIYRYDRKSKTWIKQTAMGAPSYIAVVDWGGPNLPTNVYAMIRTATCNTYNGVGVCSGMTCFIGMSALANGFSQDLVLVLLEFP